MHLHTVVKTRADNKEEAIEKVNSLLSDFEGYGLQPPFDYFREDFTQVSEEVKNEEDFKKLQEREKENAKELLEMAEKAEEGDSMKGYYYKVAGEAMLPDMFWSSERYAYDYAKWQQHEDEGKKTFYVVTDRHY